MDCSSRIQKRKKLFYNRDEFNDVTFEFPTFDVLIPANKTILALMSPVFEKLFYGSLAVKESTIKVEDDFDVKIFQEFIRILYTEEVTLDSIEKAQQLYHIANYYEVPFIEENCKEFLIANCHKGDLNNLKLFAEMFCIKELIDLCNLLLSNKPNRQTPSHWVKYKRGQPLPVGMNIIGFDTRGYPLSIGKVKKRFAFETDTLPGEFSISTGLVTSTWGGKIYQIPTNIEILCDGELDWIPSKGGIIPRNAVIGGEGYLPSNPPEFQSLGIGKIIDEEQTTVIGKIVSAYSCLFIPKLNKEEAVYQNYYILVDHLIK